MENKLQELTNKLYEEGLAKGREQADAIIKQAKEEANTIVEKAKKEAVWMVERAEKEAADHKEQVENEIRMASRHTISTLKKKIESMVVLEALEAPTRKAVEDITFIQGIIGQLAAAFNPGKAVTMDLSVILPEKQQEQFISFMESQTAQILGKNLKVSFSADLENGFIIGPGDGGYQIRFTDKDFMALFNQYISPKTQKILYGE